MKSFRLSGAFRRRSIIIGCFALVASAFASAHALERPLTDADIARHLPRLRAEAAAFTKTARETREASAAVISTVEEIEKLRADLVEGRKDILEWLRAQSNQVLIPGGAAYSAECSRAVTGEASVPTAVFTFGKESPYCDLLRRAASGNAAAVDEFNTRRGEEEIGKRSAAAQTMHDFVAGTIAFYRDRGFVIIEGNHPIIVTFLGSPDGRLSVAIWEANAYCGLLPRDTPPACSALPTGPIVEICLVGASGADAAGADVVPGEDPHGRSRRRGDGRPRLRAREGGAPPRANRCGQPLGVGVRYPARRASRSEGGDRIDRRRVRGAEGERARLQAPRGGARAHPRRASGNVG